MVPAAEAPTNPNATTMANVTNNFLFIAKKRSFNDVVLMLFRSYSFTLRACTFLTTLAELNKREDETLNESLDRLLKHKPLKLELDEEIWVCSLDKNDIESCLFGK
jgi:hypothetical protein